MDTGTGTVKPKIKNTYVFPQFLVLIIHLVVWVVSCRVLEISADEITPGLNGTSTVVPK